MQNLAQDEPLHNPAAAAVAVQLGPCCLACMWASSASERKSESKKEERERESKKVRHIERKSEKQERNNKKERNNERKKERKSKRGKKEERWLVENRAGTVQPKGHGQDMWHVYMVVVGGAWVGGGRWW